MAKGAYTKAYRLDDVLALIQVLALDEDTYRSEDGITSELQTPPRSAASWFALAGEHAEFFRVNVGKEHGLSLAARHVLPHQHGQPRPPLSPEFTSTLLETAITLHDRQVTAAERWKHLWPPVITGILTISSGVIAAVLTAHITHPASANRFVSAERIGVGVLLDTATGQYCWAIHPEKNVPTMPLPDCSTLR
jgi:hypothetical protein